MRGLRTKLGSAAVLAGCAGAFGSLDTSLNVAFPDLVDDLGLAVNDLQWVVVFYVLVYGGLLLAAGQLGDVWGYGRVLRTGALVSTVALVGCATAPTFEVLLAGRVIQGAGGAMVMASAPALLTTGSGAAQTRAISIFQTAAAAGLAIGPVVGGPLVEWLGWRGVFWFRVPLGLALLTLAFSQTQRPASAAAKVDRLGAVMVSLALGTAVLAINLAGTRGWSDPAVAATAVLAAMVGTAFIYLSNRVAHPVIELALFRSPDFATANLLAVIANGAMFATWLLVPSLLVDHLATSLLVAGVVLASSPVCTAIASSIAGRARSQTAAWSLSATGLVVEGVGMLILSRVDATWSTLHVALPMAVVGAGLGLFSVPNMAMVMRGVGHNKQGVAGGLSLMTRTIGIVAGVTTASSLVERTESTRGFLGSFSLVFVASGLVLLTASMTAAIFATRQWVGRLDDDSELPANATGPF